MGILNITPDSFYDGGRHFVHEAALAGARQMVADGAVYIDVGGESTRPGAAAVSEQQELDRVVPVIEAIAGNLDVAISVDSSRASVIERACAAGASLINDVRALTVPGALQAAVTAGVDVCLMHMQGTPGTMQSAPCYEDVVAEVRGFLATRAAACAAAGLDPQRIAVDPGIGFGKHLGHNLALLRALQHIAPANEPVVLGVSRKSMLGEITGQPADGRLYGSLAAAIEAARCGVAILRVHDIRATQDALAVWAAINGRHPPGG